MGVVTSITKHLTGLKERISSALAAAGRSQDAAFLLAVSKNHDISLIREAAANGLTDFGENYVAEAVAKINAADFPANWHFIGRIQSNKTREIASRFDWVQTVDRARIARRLSEQRPAGLEPLQVLIQVQLDPADDHGGIEPENVPGLAKLIADLPKLNLRGLMCIPAATDDPLQQRVPFRLMRQLFIDIKHDYPRIDTLSMGMSNDLEAAIMEGSTMIRIGTALFGQRTYKTDAV